MNIEIVCALSEKPWIYSLDIKEGSTVRLALLSSPILDVFPNLSLHDACIGIFSHKVNLDHVLHEGDRIEIYRPLKMDPKAARVAKVKKRK